MNLPEQFLENMKVLLGAEYDAWLTSYENTPFQGLRVNTTKVTPSDWQERVSPFELTLVPWTKNGYYYKEDVRPAKHPYYYAGLYYLQEPSAMAPAALLSVNPGDRVLDLCAAPGGKSTELGTKLCGEGLLVSNDISNSRARSLLKNLELFGIPNICVTSEAPEKLADTFGEFFDKILVDAPCSGEGMFRKDPDLVKSWLEHGPEYYAPIQREILKQAVRMLKPGGLILYSTCTFAKMEDEDTMDWILQEAPEMELVPLTPWEGACGGVDGKPVIRLFPHKIHGEGHFVALLRKKPELENRNYSRDFAAIRSDEMAGMSAKGKTAKEVAALEKESDFLEWERMLCKPLDRSRMMVKDNLVYYLPEEFDPKWKLRYLRTGLLLGEWKKQRFEPSQAVAMVLRQKEYSQTFSMSSQDERVIRYLKGETIFLEDGETLKKGWTLVCVDGYPLGWAKYTGSALKNKYYPGWRWQ
ncbi:MAG: RsmB/NOP family class I SAM-dependent RNA methyltransferase [Eubacteriales bacterium]|nr:RsmB/NOP family class I SAM-dependent RNA methyltransferase [Eubacteriales bacterium]